MLHPVGIVAFGEVFAEVGPATLLAGERPGGDGLRDIEHGAELERLHELGVIKHPPVLQGQVFVAFLKLHQRLPQLLQRLFLAEHGYLFGHLPAQLPPDGDGRNGAFSAAQRADFLCGPSLRVSRERRPIVFLHIARHVGGRAPPEDQDIHQRVRTQTVRPVHGYTGALAGRIETGQRRVLLVDDHARFLVGRYAAHGVMGRRLDGDGQLDGVDAQIGAHEVGNVG